MPYFAAWSAIFRPKASAALALLWQNDSRFSHPRPAIVVAFTPLVRTGHTYGDGS